jgi:hypothetical protein
MDLWMTMIVGRAPSTDLPAGVLDSRMSAMAILTKFIIFSENLIANALIANWRAGSNERSHESKSVLERGTK